MDDLSRKVVGYPRVSTDDQAKHGLSPADQEAMIRSYCQANDLELVDIIADMGESSKTLERPGLRRILAMLLAGEARGIVVTHLDRLTRHVGDMVHLVEQYFGDDRGLEIISLGQPVDTRTASGRMLIYIQIVVSQYQRESTAERTADTMARKRERGERIGTIPYGWQLGPDGKTLEPCYDELLVYELMMRLRRSGVSYRHIAAYLDDQDIKPRSGGNWAASSVAKILGSSDAAAAA